MRNRFFLQLPSGEYCLLDMHIHRLDHQISGTQCS
jgi:hypothetical protein